MRYSVLALAINSLSLQYALANESSVNPNAEQNDNTAQIFHLSPIDVYVTPRTDVGATYYSQEKIGQTANSNKTISDFLKVNPNVQFSQDAMAGGEQGELKATDISINGALPYDNKLLLDNISLNNLINPADGSNDFAITGMGGSSFATTINTDLICDLTVLDSNVSAEYGEFTGGVVQAKTCAPKTAIGQLHGSVSYDYTSSAWSRFNYVDEDEFLLFENNQHKEYQKDYIKQGLATQLYGRLSEDLAFSLGASKRWSEIDYTTKLVNTLHSPQQKRDNQNINLNLYANLNPQHQLKLGLQYQNDHANLNQVHVRDSGKRIDEENTALEFELKSSFDAADVTQSLVYQQQKRDNQAQRNELVVWLPSESKNWSNSNTATQGGYGHQQQQLDRLEYKIKAELKPFDFLDTQHRMTVGAGYGHYQAEWARLGATYSYFKPSGVGIAGIDSCLNASGERDAYCDESYEDGKGQYHIRRHHYHAGDIGISQDRGYIFIEDNINWQNMIKANLGMRAEYDSISKQTHLAPRTSLHYLPFADERLKLTTGWNRYYANNAFNYKLQDGINNLSYDESRKTIDDAWLVNGPALKSNVARSQLDVPATDETVFAISSRLGILDGQIKYVHRDNKDQVHRYRTSFSPLVYEYGNWGKSQADVVTFTLSNHIPLTVGSSLNHFTLALDHTDIKRNFNSSEDSFILENEVPYSIYNGKIIVDQARPAANFSRPWTARLSVDSAFQNIPLKISQSFRYRSDYDAMVSSSIPKAERPEFNGYIIEDRYEATRIAGAFTWDVRTTYDVNIGKDQYMTFGLTVNNLLNKHNKYTESGESKLKSELGRQFVADIRFNF